MLHGIKINGVDTLEAYGLILLSDLKIDEPELKETYVDIPGADGSLNLSYALAGRPTYKNRDISFTLYKRVEDDALKLLREQLMNAYHGRQVTLQPPFETDAHYNGVIQFGALSGYRSGKIPVTMSADPWKLKNSKTVVVSNISETGVITLQNWGKPVSLKISTTAAITITWGSNSVSLSAGADWLVPNLVLQADETSLAVTGTSTVTITYQEGSL
ncbi:MAG: hypothetical protein VB055_06130 [Oscillospiraceae bacterium]|nr:hypothetical protein [Oscillospiraceae bacterium]